MLNNHEEESQVSAEVGTDTITATAEPTTTQSATQSAAPAPTDTVTLHDDSEAAAASAPASASGDDQKASLQEQTTTAGTDTAQEVTDNNGNTETEDDAVDSANVNANCANTDQHDDANGIANTDTAQVFDDDNDDDDDDDDDDDSKSFASAVSATTLSLASTATGLDIPLPQAALRARMDDNDNGIQQRRTWSENLRIDRWGNIISIEDGGDEEDKKDQDQAVADDTTTRWKKKRAKLEKKQRAKEVERENKWLRMWKKWSKVSTKRKEKLKRRIRKGIPDSLRPMVWPHLAGAVEAKAELGQDGQVFETLVSSQVDHETEIQIKKDKVRTMQSHVMFRNKTTEAMVNLDTDQGIGQMVLFKVLKALSLHFPDVGYCQAMCSPTAMMVSYVPDEDAFWVLERVFAGPKYGDFKNMFKRGFPLLFEYLYIHDNLIRSIMPKVYKRLQSLGLDSTMYGPAWYSTIFSRMPIALVLRIWDIFLHEGPKILFRVGLGIIKVYKPKIMSLPFEETIMILQRPDEDSYFSQHVDEFIKLCLSIPVRTKKIDKYRRRYLEQSNR
jgi:ecotropic viral integration site 5 protein